VASTRYVRISRAVIGFSIAGSLLIAPMAAQALPGHQTPSAADVTAKLTDLATKNEQLTEQLNAAKIAVAKAQTKQKAAADAAAQAQGAMQQAQRALASTVAARYKASSFSQAAALLTSSDGNGYFETLQSMTVIAQHQAEIAKAAANASGEAREADAEAKSAVEDAVAKRSEVTTTQNRLAGEITRYQDLLTTLTAPQVTAYYQQDTAQPGAVAQAVAKVTLSAAASGAAGKAVQVALAQQGDPYVYGAAGPDTFDCSGLTSFAWAAAGVSLPHNAAAQQAMGTPVPSDQLAPGDLVFFGSPAYHVGMYIGNGLFVHAPTSGDVVKVSPLANKYGYSGAARVG